MKRRKIYSVGEHCVADNGNIIRVLNPDMAGVGSDGINIRNLEVEGPDGALWRVSYTLPYKTDVENYIVSLSVEIAGGLLDSGMKSYFATDFHGFEYKLSPDMKATTTTGRRSK
ncbi:hypothetical protein [Maricaulis alexandrii]|uniref:hypothetical protein n=1 Tax=Maricaulis alexandrii TaxID=2570354 RepID=UPI001109554D|nr:hypothetical protein [Maricaulis alexandrii]